ncbi:MAG: CBS domain-containing protein [Proteobacteria bacterium]|nr:CBS domain-containing protein [Pseudomonadota bacterium]MBU1057963.1 CBS domain-containing protein [Pseudomonadota bacterium]
MKVKEILATKGNEVVTVEENTTVIDAMTIFSANRIGSLLVVDKDDTIQGIIDANDVLTAVVNQLENIKILTVNKIMTTNLIVATEDDDIDYILAVMTENRVRHITILANKELKGMISIGDVVKSQLKQMDVENKYLKDYIAGKYQE